MSGPTPDAPTGDAALAIICGGGSLPFALADAAIRRGRRVVLFALRGWADPQRVAAYPHHWAWIGQFGRFLRLAAQEGCRDVAFIGSVVRPSLWQHPAGLRRVAADAADRAACFAAATIICNRASAGCSSSTAFVCSARRRSRRNWLMPRGPIGARVARASGTAPTSRAAWRCSTPRARSTSARRWWSPTIRCWRWKGPEGTDRTLARVARTAPRRPHQYADGHRRAGQGAKARPGPSHRSAGDRAADHRGRGAPRALPASRSSPARRSWPSPSASLPRPTAPGFSSSASMPMGPNR